MNLNIAQKLKKEAIKKGFVALQEQEKKIEAKERRQHKKEEREYKKDLVIFQKISDEMKLDALAYFKKMITEIEKVARLGGSRAEIIIANDCRNLNLERILEKIRDYRYRYRFGTIADEIAEEKIRIDKDIKPNILAQYIINLLRNEKFITEKFLVKGIPFYQGEGFPSKLIITASW